jgi:hypothetical protein
MTDMKFYHSFDEFEEVYFPIGRQVSKGELMKNPSRIGNKFASELLEILKK